MTAIDRVLSNKTVVSLTPAAMEQIHQAIEETTARPVVAAVKATFECLGVDWAGLARRREGKLHPMEYSIPQDQWCQIDEWIMVRTDALTGASLSVVNSSMDWINYGPSVHENDSELISMLRHPSGGWSRDAR